MERLITFSTALLCCACVMVEAERGDTEEIPGNGGTGTRLKDYRTELKASIHTHGSDTVDLFMYDDDALRRLDTYQREPLGNGPVKVAGTSGAKILAAIANSRRGRYIWQESNSFAYIEGLDANFAEDSPEHPVMSGICRIRENEGGGEADGYDQEVPELTLTPLLSKIRLRSIRCDFAGRAYEGATLDEAQVYLTNVSSICGLFQEKDFHTRGTLNTGRLDMDALDRISDPSMLHATLPPRIGRDFVETDISLYCYPNTNEEESFTTPFTRLVIEGKIEGSRWFWPIDINRESICWVEGTPGIVRGTLYEYDVTIKRTGTQDPDIPVTLQEVSLVCDAVPWREENRDEIF